MLETWRPVVGYEGFYEISNLGNLVRVSTYGGKPRRKPRAFALKGGRDSGGYRAFHLCANGIRKYRFAHIMVWEAFKCPIPEGFEVNHKDGDRNNPSIDNLELLTKSENHKHAYRVLKRRINVRPQLGAKNGSSKLTESQVIEIRKRHASGDTQQRLAHEFGVSQPMIGFITRREKWQHI